MTEMTKNVNSFDISVQGATVQQIRNISYIICTLDGIDTQFSFAVLAIPTNSSCEPPKFTEDKNNVSLTCKTTKVFPQSKCLFEFNNRISIEHGTVTYKHQEVSTSPIYYESECTWTSFLSNFEAGYYNFYVSILPNLTDNRMYGQNVTSGLSVNLTQPTVRISNECYNTTNVVDGYIKPDTAFSCQCFLDQIGNPPGYIKWLDTRGLVQGNSINKTHTFLNILPIHDLNQFRCTGFSELRNGNISASYSVRYAKRPTTCLVQLKDTSRAIWTMCTHTFINFSIICQVNEADAIPGIKGKVSINSVYSNLMDSTNIKNTFQITREINITEAGRYFIGCQVQNTLFSDALATCSYSQDLQLIAPPTSSQIIQLINIIQENKYYTFQCEAHGGIPSVSNVTVSCGNIKDVTQSGNIFTSPVTFTRNMAGQNCTCTAEHITGCYENNTSILKLNILYKSAIIGFNVTSRVIDNGKFVQFYCEADDNPIPKMFIVKENETIAQNSSGYYLYYNKSMSCRDAGYYFCQANNGIDVNSDESKQITVFVRCPLQLTSNEIQQSFSLQQGKLFSYKFTVYGYPEPDKITILKSNQVSNNVLVTNSSLEPPYVRVELKIFSLSSADFGIYTLIMFQNGLQTLSLIFIINEETGINFGAAVGGSLAACVVVISVVVVVVVKRKYEITCKKKISNKEPKQTQTYSELSLSQQLKDKHNYETPIHSRNLSNNEVTDKTANYMNVKDIDIPVGNDNSLYCNTQNENVHQQIAKTVVLIGHDKGVSQHVEIDNIKP
ncbi:hypothetical protein BgiBS90_018849 [Biomphalaria glabrata]|nr:hypothetical protein BgiBS90_018849 [Biomphalaria glabrata]